MISSSRLLWPLVLACFFVSGLAGLVYQVVWARYLGLFLGQTSYAVVAVLVAFMAGLAIGNAWLGARADRVRQPLALYGWLELGIGVYALVFPLLETAAYDGFVSIARSAGMVGGSRWLLKFGCSLALILLPTILMGATLPVLTRYVTRSLSDLRRNVGRLYFINSAGAVAGCVVADFWWIPAYGLQATVCLAATINVAAGLLALGISRRMGEDATNASPEEPSTADKLYTSSELRLAVVGVGISGFVAMLYEVVWTRILALTLGSSTHAFGLMLITFISGIATGAWCVSRWRRQVHELRAFAWAELALAACLVVSMFFYELLPLWFSELSGLLARKPDAYPIYALLQLALCFAVMFAPTCCLGLTLPLVSRVATEQLARTGRSVGRVFAVNTLGTVLGAALTGLWLMPQFGLAGTLGIGVALNATLAWVILRRPAGLLRPAHIVGPLVAGAFIALTIAWLFTDPWQRAFTAGLWRILQPPTDYAGYREWLGRHQVLYHRDGAGATVNVERHQKDGKPMLALKVNGKPDASTGNDIKTQLMLGHLPMLLHPEATHALVIGLGSGITGGAVMQHPGVERLDVAEISPEVVEAARWFQDHNHRVLENPRMRLHVEDAKAFLLTTDQRYDVIISEPSNPWMAGVAGVFSVEFYQTCRDHLRPNGRMVQWVQAYESSDEAFNMVLGTFASVFPHVAIWQGAFGDLLLVGSTQRWEVDLAALERRFEIPAVRAEMERMGIQSLPGLLWNEIVTSANGYFLVADSQPIHSDYFPALEFIAQRAFFVRGQATRWTNLAENEQPRADTLLARYLRQHPLSDLEWRRFAESILANPVFPGPFLRSALLRWQQEVPDAGDPCLLLTRLGDKASAAQLDMLRLGPFRDHFLEQATQDPRPLRHYASVLMESHRELRSALFTPNTEAIEQVTRRLIEVDKVNQRSYALRLAELAWDRGADAACLELGLAAFDPDPNRGGPVTFALDPKTPGLVLQRMLDVYLRQNRTNEAVSLAHDAVRLGYVRGPAGVKDSRLDLLCRKILSTQN